LNCSTGITIIDTDVKNMIAIIDYNVGNLLSAQNAFGFLGADTIVTGDKRLIEVSDAIILPGVGAFPDAMESLKKTGLDKIIKDQVKKGKPLLGICLGMQLLFETSYEIRPCEGLGLIKGEIQKIQTTYKIPHMGWNSLNFDHPSSMFDGIQEGAYVYFVHSYCAHVTCKEDLVASCDYGSKITAAVAHDNVWGTQFHPEKSSTVGLQILKNFLTFVEKAKESENKK
jgi:glutamine amidotransferase